MFILTKVLTLIVIPLSLSHDISKQELINNSFIQLLNLIKNKSSLDELTQTHFNNCKNKINSMNYDKLYELFENSGKQISDIGNFWDCVARNFSYHIININKKSLDIDNKAIIFLRKKYSDLGLCIPNECNDILNDFINSEYFKDIYSIKNTSIFSYIPLSNGGKKKQNHYNLEKTEIAAIIFFAFILILFFIKILTPIIFGTCLYKYSYLKYTIGNNYISVEDNLTDDDEELNDDNDNENDNVQLFRVSKLTEIKNEEVNNLKNITLKYVIFKKHIQSFFSININFNLLLSHKNFLYNNNLLQPLSFFKSITLFMLFYNESFYALINLPVKNNANEKFYYSFPMIWMKYSSFFIDVYIALEGFLFIYKLFNYIIKHHNCKYLGLTLLFFYAKTIPKLITCICIFFIFNIGLRVIEENFDLSPFVEYIGAKHQKICLINLSYIFIPFKLQYTYNNSCVDRLYELCYRYMYINLNMQISITFFLVIIYLIFKFKDEIFDKLILFLFFLNSILSPFSCHHYIGDKFNFYILNGETCTIKLSHLFLNKFFFGMIFGIIYFYHNDIISQTPLGKIYFKDKFIPFSYCRKIMKLLDKTSPGLKIIFVLISILMQIFLSSIFIFYERANKDLTFNINGFDWILIDNYEKKIFIFFFMFMLINLLFMNKISNSMIYKWLIFNLVSRSSFSIFCSMHMLIYFIYSNYYIKIYLNFYNIIFISISHFVICLFLNIIFTLLTEQSLKIICKNIFGELQNRLFMETADLQTIIKSNFKNQKKVSDNSLSDTFELS
jgi:hypothetical protein